MKKSDFQLIAGALSLLKAGIVEVRTNNTKSLVVSLDDDDIGIDFHDPSLFRTPGRKKFGILDYLQEMRSLGKALAEKNITLSISRKNNLVLHMGKKAKPSFSRIATRSKDIQIVSLRELRKLDGEL